MKHPKSKVKLKAGNDMTILKDVTRTWEAYRNVIRRYRQLMDEAETNLRIEVKSLF